MPEMNESIKKEMTPDTPAVLDCATRAGRILLENGAEITRVEDTMKRISHCFGVDDEDFFVLSNGIFTTGNSRDRHKLYANVRHIPVKGTRMDKIAAVNQLSRELWEATSPMTLEDCNRRLDAIETMPIKNNGLRILASGVASASFCLLFGGSFFDSLAAFLAGLLLYVFVVTIFEPHLSKITGNLLSGALVTLLCILFSHLGLGHSMNHMIIGAIIPLVPGVAMTYGVRDIASGDYISGSVRLLDAILVFLCIAIGVGTVFTMLPSTMASEVPDTAYSLLFQGIIAFPATVSFALLFSVPRQYYLPCGIIGILGWVAYVLACNAGLQVAYATFIGAVMVVFASRWCAVWLRCPQTIFMISGLFPLIPGAGFYWTAYYLVIGESARAATAGIEALKIVIGLVLGIVCILELPNRIFHVKKH